jgi:hypothetical protein
MSTARRILTIGFGAAFALGGCGTNVRSLMTQDSHLVIEADRAVSVAETLGTGLEQPVYDAEATKGEACQFINDAVVDQMEREPTFGEQFASDLSMFIVLLVPVGDVERCAQALEAYRGSVNALERQLVALGAMTGPRDYLTAAPAVPP